MKKVLVLTDFTANATHAEVAAFRICSKLEMDLLLYHSIKQAMAMPAGCNATSAIGVNPTLEYYNAKLIKEVETLKNIALEPTGYQPTISFICGKGNLSEDIKRLSEKPEIYLLVIGGRHGKTIDHLFSGSETKEVINNSRKPVLIIPQLAHLEHLEKVIFATDFAKADMGFIRFLIELREPLGFRLEAVHVVKPSELYADFQHELVFESYLVQQKVPYETLFNDTITPRLQAYCYQTGADLLAMKHGHHTWISRTFGRSQSEVATDSRDIATMIFPPDIKKR